MRSLRADLGRAVELHLRRAVALEETLDPEEHLGPDRLWAGIAAPEPPGQRREKEKAETREDEQGREIDEVLRPEGQAEEIELARGEVEDDGLVTFPTEPGQTVEDPEQHAGGRDP